MEAPPPFSPDTSPDVQALLVERWRRMSSMEKAQLVDRLTRDCETLALAGIRDLHPDATPEEIRFQLAVRRFGRELALRAYPPSRAGG